jgi:hypothetical protein
MGKNLAKIHDFFAQKKGRSTERPSDKSGLDQATLAAKAPLGALRRSFRAMVLANAFRL